MSDVARFVREFEEVVYTVGPDTVRQAVLNWLTNEHGASFTDETTLKFCAGDSIAVTTRFASVDARPKDGDAPKIAAPLASSAVRDSADAPPSPSVPQP